MTSQNAQSVHTTERMMTADDAHDRSLSLLNDDRAYVSQCHRKYLNVDVSEIICDCEPGIGNRPYKLITTADYRIRI